MPSLRTLRTFTDDAMHDHVVASSGIRLPLDFDDGTIIQAAGYRFEGPPTPEFLKITNPVTPFTPFESYIFTRTVGILPDNGII